MKKFLSLAVFALYSFCAMAQQDQPYKTVSLAGKSINAVDVKTSGGSIKVMGGNDAQARVEVFVKASNNQDKISKEELDRRLQEDYILDVSVTNNKVMAMAKPKERNMNWKKALSISFTVYTPTNITTDLATSGGSIHLANVTGQQEFSTSGGSLNIESVKGKVNGRTSGGSINVKNSSEDLNLSTSGGSITAANCKGNIKLSTSGGSLNLSQLDGTIKASTSGGSIQANNISGDLSAHTSGGSVKMSELLCSLETSTSGGQVDVAIKQYGKYLTVRNSGGNINLQLPGSKGVDLDFTARKINTGTVANFSGKIL